MSRSLSQTVVSFAALLLCAVVLLPTSAHAFTPYSVLKEFNVLPGSGTTVTANVPAGMLWVVENVSGRIVCPTDSAPINALAFQQPDVNALAENVIYMVPQIVALNTFIGVGPKDLYMFRSSFKTSSRRP